MNLEDRNQDEEEFHNNWAQLVDIQAVRVEQYFTAPTAIECQYSLKIMGPLKGRKILDLGCGFGEASVWLALQGAKVTALDISSQMLKCVRVLAEKYGVKERIVLVKAAAEKLPLKSANFDLVFGGNILHHVDIDAAAKQIKRVLKPAGKAVFIEPLGYNPVINIYRKMAKDVRTKMERPFRFEDINLVGRGFSKVAHHEFQLLSTLIFVWFFIGEKLHPSKVRYWKRFIEKGEDYLTGFKILNRLDRLVLRISFLRRYCWNTVIELVK